MIEHGASQLPFPCLPPHALPSAARHSMCPRQTLTRRPRAQLAARSRPGMKKLAWRYGSIMHRYGSALCYRIPQPITRTAIQHSVCHRESLPRRHRPRECCADQPAPVKPRPARARRDLSRVHRRSRSRLHRQSG